MIVKENIEIGGRAFVKTYSDAGVYIERDGLRYSEAIDLSGFGRTYTETDIPVEAEATTETEQKAEAYDYLTGRTESEVESNE